MLARPIINRVGRAVRHAIIPYLPISGVNVYLLFYGEACMS
jgi:hypothetical protein